MKKLIMLWFALFAMTTAGHSEGTVILSLERTGPAAIGVGDTATFDLRISGLTTLLGAFSVDNSFDPTILSFMPVGMLGAQFGSLLGDPTSEAVGIADASVPGVLHLDEVSLLGTAELDALQRDALGNLLPSFVLVTVAFQGVGPGVGLLDFVPGSVTLSDDAGTALSTPALGPAVVRVISLPGTLWLFGLGLCITMASMARRRV